MFKRTYDVTDDGRPLTELSRYRRESCQFAVDGVTYSVSRDGRKRFVLAGPNGRVADAGRETGRLWSFTAAVGRIELIKPSMWRGWEVRHHGAAGPVRAGGLFAKYYTVDVPAGIPLPVQVFVLYVALVIFERQQAAAAGAGAAAASAGS